MQIWHSETEIPPDWTASVVTLGVFDGVHAGHQRIIEYAVDAAKKLGVPSVLVTFDPHPRSIVGSAVMPKQLITIPHRAELARESGIDVFFVKNFTHEFAAKTPEEFITDFLVGTLKARAIIVGENFRFGAHAAGDCALLAHYGQKFGFTVYAAPLVGVPEYNYSATKVRSLISDGQVAEAARILGRPHRVEGTIVKGFGRGRMLGFPTANLATESSVAIPEEGVYAGWFTILNNHDGTLAEDLSCPKISENIIEPFVAYPCAISVGTNPTFDDMGKPTRTVEAYVLDASANLYSCYVGIDFVERIRGQKKFASVDELVTAMIHDVTCVRTVLGK